MKFGEINLRNYQCPEKNILTRRHLYPGLDIPTLVSWDNILSTLTEPKYSDDNTMTVVYYMATIGLIRTDVFSFSQNTIIALSWIKLLRSSQHFTIWKTGWVRKKAEYFEKPKK